MLITMVNPCTGDQVTGGDKSGEHVPSERLQKVPAPASYLWMCATFQKDLFASLVSCTDSRTDTVGPVTVPFLRSGVF